VWLLKASAICPEVWCWCDVTGLIARLCNTLVVAASMAAVSESLAVGKRLGVDAKVLTEVRGSYAGGCKATPAYVVHFAGT